MAISHFTLHQCPNPECPANTLVPPERETAIGDPVTMRWHCFRCLRSGSIFFVIDGEPMP
jgi:hypothetical protein